MDLSESNHLWSVLESQCPSTRSFYLYPKAKYENLYLAPYFDVGRFENKFPFDPEGNFKDVEIEAKNLGLGNGHGSKRSLFVTEDFVEEDGELQRTIIKKLLIHMYCHCLDKRN